MRRVLAVARSPDMLRSPLRGWCAAEGLDGQHLVFVFASILLFLGVQLPHGSLDLRDDAPGQAVDVPDCGCVGISQRQDDLYEVLEGQLARLPEDQLRGLHHGQHVDAQAAHGQQGLPLVQELGKLVHRDALVRVLVQLAAGELHLLVLVLRVDHFLLRGGKYADHFHQHSHQEVHHCQGREDQVETKNNAQRDVVSEDGGGDLGQVEAEDAVEEKGEHRLTEVREVHAARRRVLANGGARQRKEVYHQRQ
mmetsp:Transcript_29758/g.70773  ORF Transcript_29758/g.70773 Transcript_29758/m.70773 type:complete len:251 (-) Transcript_29758:1345-2097(-)